MNQLELRDIHLPETSLWWPPAPGWWLLAVLLLGLAGIALHLLRRRRARGLQRESLRELREIERAFARQRDARASLLALSGLLRRTLISYRGRAGYADSVGDAFAAQLRELGAGDAFDADQLRLLGHERYRRECDYDVAALLAASRRWIRALPRSPGDAAA